MFSRAAILAVVVLAAGQAAASARSLTASDPRKEFVFSNELLAELARNPPKTAAPLNPPTPGGRAGARIIAVSALCPAWRLAARRV